MSKPHPDMRIVPPSQPVPGERLDSWKEIASYLKRDVRTVQRWEKNDGLPIYRMSKGHRSGPVYAFTSEIDAWLHKNPPSHAEKEPALIPASQTVWRMSRVFWAVALLFILVTGAVVSWYIRYRGSSSPPIRVLNLTSYSGMEQFPALSSDGKWIAFSWDGPNHDNVDIYVKSVDGGEPRRLTTNLALDGYPVWSPDGRHIAFVRMVSTSKVEGLIMSALGGDERSISQFSLPPQHYYYWPPFCWTPDGKWIIAPIPPETLGLLSPETREVRALIEPTAGSTGDCCPAISPDGRSLAFLHASPGRIWNLYIQPLNGDYSPAGVPKQKTFESGGVVNPMWTANGREVLYITHSGGERVLWRAPVEDFRAASRVESLSVIGINWTISGDRLAYQSNRDDIDIWRIELTGEKGVSRTSCSSSMGDQSPQISPDGEKVAFVSGREKGTRIWVSALDGTNAIPLAPILGSRPGIARWSPDGKELAFECKNEVNDDICVVPSSGGAVRRVTSNPARDSYPSWSLDGKWIYVTSNRSGSFQIWKVPSDGTEADAVQITQGGGWAAQESANGYIYFAREWMDTTIWRVPSGGGKETQFGTFSNLGEALGFTVGREGIYYASDGESSLGLWLCRFSTGKSERIKRINKKPYHGLSIAPDERYILFSAADPGSSDLWMVENFR